MKGKKITYASAIILMGFIILMGICADKNLFDFSVRGIKASNYEFSDNNGNSAELDYAVNFPHKTCFVDLNGAIRKLFHQHEMNGVTKLNNGYLAILNDKIPQASLDEYAKSIIKYNDFCKQNGVIFLYVQPAYKISKYDSELPVGDVDYTNENMDYLGDKLKKNNISVIDLRECMHNDGIDQYKLYYKTDHHWNTEGAFYAYQHIAKWITKQTGCTLDSRLIDLNNYSITKYYKWHLGSYGQRTGKYYAGIDDYDLICPKFNTELISSDGKTKGSFENVIVNMDVFNKRDATSRYTYDSALAKPYSGHLRASDAKSKLSVYMISDSYSEAVDPYMLLTYRDYSKGSLYDSESLSTSVLKEINPDVVILMPFAGNLAYYAGAK